MNTIHHCGAAVGRVPHRQRGIVLFTSLILLVILTLVGVMMSRLQMVEEQIALNDQDQQMAVQAAEATLRYAEADDQFRARFVREACAVNGRSSSEQGPRTERTTT